jgi:hypothetical protein
MSENTGLSDDKVMHPLALAMQGMAVWHLLLGIGALVFTVTITLAQPSASDDDIYGMSALTGAEVTGGALAAALILGGVSWAMLGRAFWRPRWSIILIPGLIGTLVTGLFDLMGWPVSYLIGGAIAYWLVGKLLEQASPANSTES